MKKVVFGVSYPCPRIILKAANTHGRYIAWKKVKHNKYHWRFVCITCKLYIYFHILKLIKKVSFQEHSLWIGSQTKRIQFDLYWVGTIYTEHSRSLHPSTAKRKKKFFNHWGYNFSLIVYKSKFWIRRFSIC